MNTKEVKWKKKNTFIDNTRYIPAKLNSLQTSKQRITKNMNLSQLTQEVIMHKR